ncbi:MAG: SLC13/DASS family transporter [Rhodobiaceae bacterium]|nr:SLC13/DASS family transporter [Rhodobiaceae bacterium]
MGQRRKALIGLVAGLALFAAILLLPAPSGFSSEAWRVAALALLMAVWWMSEAAPLAATALLPVVLLPVLGVQPVETVAGAYAHSIVFLILGGFLIAAALQRWGLHRAVAAAILRMAPEGPSGTIAAVMAATAFLSMWISNTATAMVMVPIGQSIIHGLGAGREPGMPEGTAPAGNFAPALMLAIAFSATIGGMGTLIGTPPNALLAGYLSETSGIQIGFAQWMLLGVPVVLVLLPATWLLLTRGVFREFGFDRASRSFAAPASAPLSTGARLTGFIVALAGAFLVLRPLVEEAFPAIAIGDAGIVMAAALLLFVLPAFDGKGGHLLGWEEAKTIRWDVLILFGGGLALAGAIDSSGLSSSIGALFVDLGALPVGIIVLAAMVAIVYLGELASNTAMAAVFLPVAGAIAASLDIAPADFLVPIGLAASLGFMLPVATPPNAIVYGSGEVTSTEMLKAGAILDLAGIAIVYGLAMLIVPKVF